MPQRLRTRLPNAVVFRFLLNDRGLPARFNPRQFELIAENRGQLLQRDIDLQQVPATRIAPRRSLTVFRIAALGYWLAFLAVSLPNAPCPVVAKSEMWDIQRRHRDADQITTLPADHLAVRNVLPQILADPAADNLSKAALIALNFHDHKL